MKEANKTCRAKKVNVSLTASVKRKFLLTPHLGRQLPSDLLKIMLCSCRLWLCIFHE